MCLGGEGKEIKHFNYSRLVGGASYRQQSCNKDRWKRNAWDNTGLSDAPSHRHTARNIISTMPFSSIYIPLTWTGL